MSANASALTPEDRAAIARAREAARRLHAEGRSIVYLRVGHDTSVLPLADLCARDAAGERFVLNARALR